MIQIPGYLIKREIGAGGMATVYLAVQTSLEREVALKVMNPAMVADTTFSRRFMQEARTLASLAHPNIVAVYDVGITEEKLHYFSMQHLPHGDFLARIRSGISELDVVRVIAGVLRALGFAHQRGFVHRDVAPGNVLFDANGNPVLTDFGIARAVSKTSRITNAGVSVGTSHYMSPEQARGGDVDGRSDIYSLGAVTFEALTGRAPYEGDDGFAIAYAHVFEPVPRLPETVQHWQPFIDKAMAKDPAHRFQNTDEMALALGDIEHRLSPATAGRSGQQASIDGNAPTLLLRAPGGSNTTSFEAPVAEELKRLEQAARQQISGTPATSKKSSRLPVLVVAALAVVAVVLIGYGLRQSFSGAAPAATPSPSAALTAPPRPSGTETPSKPMEPMPVDGAETEADEVAVAAREWLGVEDPEAAKALAFAVATTVVDPIVELQRHARADLAANRLTLPPERNATDRYRLLLRLRPDLPAGSEGLLATGRAMMAIADRQLAEGKTSDYFATAAKAIEIAAEHDREGALKQSVAAVRSKLAAPDIEIGNAAVLRWDAAAAKSAFERALAVDPGNSEAQQGLRQAETVGRPGYAFVDVKGAVRAPEMIIARVAGRRLGVSRSEITRGEFQRFVDAVGLAQLGERPSCRDRESFFRSSKTRTWQEPGFAQDAMHPVVCVTPADADAYVRWLAEQTGRRYRLLTAAEWKGLAAASAVAQSCGNNIADRAFNQRFRDRDALACSDGFAETAPTRHFAADAGVFDLAGNVREWVSDCVGNGCSKRMVMGPSWMSGPNALDPRQQDSFDADTAFNTVGFRIAREID